MNSVSSRVEQAQACTVINLSQEEKDLYAAAGGAGWKLARFVDGVLVQFFDPQETEWRSDTRKMIDEANQAALTWLASGKGETWLVLCSCYQLCEPRPIGLDDPSALAHMARVIGEQLMDGA